METKTLQTTLFNHPFVLESGLLANLADGAVTLRLGDNVLLATVCMRKDPNLETDFLPLTIEYQERFYATGKIKGGRFMKREGKPSDTAILHARLTDRPLRPLFPKGMINDVQVVITTLSADEKTDLGALSIIAASAAIMKAGIPFDGPASAVRIGMIDGKLILNPTNEQAEKGDLDLIVAGTKDAILMVEAGAKFVSESTLIQALDMAHQAIREICILQEKFISQFSITKKEVIINIPDDSVVAAIQEYVEQEHLMDTLYVASKHELSAQEEALKLKIFEQFKDKIDHEEFPEWSSLKVNMAIFQVLKKGIRKNILEKEKRLDGRKLNEIRPITCMTSLLPRTHGSAVFKRGDTQALCIVTLGSPGDAQVVDEMEGEEYVRRYMHHYNMPPYATGEVKAMRGIGRREIGHGYLAERAILPVLPDEKEFPYTIRVVSEIVASNGSTSMASTCGSCLALMDAGVPLKAPVSGIAMGLITDEKGNFKVLSDIQGMEDFTGDMDFKVAGTKDGVTALQMDIKVKGITLEIMKQALMQAHEGRAFILEKMLEALPAPRKELSPFAPKIISMQINPEQIREVIGTGGKVINKIIAETGAKIDITDDGHIAITATSQESGEKAKQWIEDITYVPQVGDVLEGEVVRLATFGVFVAIRGGKDGLIHISNMFPYRVDRLEDKVKIGDKLKVKVIGIDEQGRISLSHKEFATR
jgi:polyribonucleotide nucleotidyltransferase